MNDEKPRAAGVAAAEVVMLAGGIAADAMDATRYDAVTVDAPPTPAFLDPERLDPAAREPDPVLARIMFVRHLRVTDTLAVSLKIESATRVG